MSSHPDLCRFYSPPDFCNLAAKLLQVEVARLVAPAALKTSGRLYVAALWEEEIFKGSEIGRFGGLGGPGSLGGHFAGPGGLAPTFLKGLRGTRGTPGHQNDQFPTFNN